MNRRMSWVLALLLALGWTAAVAAQQTAPPDRSAPQPAEEAGRTDELLPDLEIVATVRMRELRVVEAPQGARVVFRGEPERWTTWRTDEQNMPEEVASGATYLDALIRLTIASTFIDDRQDVQPPLAPVGAEPAGAAPAGAAGREDGR